MFTEREKQILAAVCNTLAPSLGVQPDPDGLFARSASDIGVPNAVATAIETVADPTNQFLSRLALFTLDHPIANWLLGGLHRSFVEMNLDQRTAILARWRDSSIPLLRRAFQAFKRLALYFFYTLLNDNRDNPNWSAIGYSGPSAAVAETDKPIKPLQVTEPTMLYTDVVIVGSGAGGGVVAGELTATGLDVIVLEKGSYYTEAEFDGHELASTQRMFENQGLLTTADLGVVVLAGSTLGGGTTINWCASFRTPEHVLREWAHDYGVTDFVSSDYQQALDSVSQRINVNVDECHANPQNEVLAQGGTALGYEVGTIPRNVKGCGDCGFCNFGCKFGSKQSTVRTYLQDAYNRGARILVNAVVDRVIIEAGRATGVEAIVQSPTGQPINVRIKANIVVVSAGTIHTPAVLIRSGLTNANIGRNLHLHPTAPTYGLYDRLIQGWSGVMMSRYIPQFNNLDGKGYGVVLECAPIHPGIAALALSWENGLQHKSVMRQLSNLGNVIIITRDRDGGRVTVDKRGKPILHYTVSDYDRKHLVKGVVEALKIQLAAGAHEISAPYSLPRLYRPREQGNFEDYVQSVQRTKFRKNGFMLLSAHQMSSCRMGANPALGAIKPTGETFEVRNLFVADASALPTATGVNPMLTIMSVSHVIAGHIKARSGK